MSLVVTTKSLACLARTHETEVACRVPSRALRRGRGPRASIARGTRRWEPGCRLSEVLRPRRVEVEPIPQSFVRNMAENRRTIRRARCPVAESTDGALISGAFVCRDARTCRSLRVISPPGNKHRKHARHADSHLPIGSRAGRAPADQPAGSSSRKNRYCRTRRLASRGRESRNREGRSSRQRWCAD